MKNFARTATMATLVMATLAAGGCTNNSELDKMRADIAANREAAARAQTTADNAAQAAHTAEVTARDASAGADAANARIDRMFKKAMYK